VHDLPRFPRRFRPQIATEALARRQGFFLMSRRTTGALFRATSPGTGAPRLFDLPSLHVDKTVT